MAKVNYIAYMGLWKKRFIRHYNGTCKCYIKVDGKTRGSGKDCEFSKLNGKEQEYIRQFNLLKQE